MNEFPPENIDPQKKADSDGMADRTLWEELGIAPPSYTDKGYALVDHELLRAYVRGELTTEVRHNIHKLVDTNREWADGHKAALQERMRSTEFQKIFDEEFLKKE